ncbi:MAG: FeoC-like transcriptional regulator [Rhodospirillales bacterium]|nr:FeoC-like transcriptional regulator [Rhodospirillales bacterium]
MILADVRDYMRDRHRAPLSDLESRFEIDAAALRDMLDHWIRKGRIRRIDSGNEGSCSSCCGCAKSAPEIYEWIGSGPATG